MEKITSKESLVQMMKGQLSTERQCLKALVTIYNNQTETEKDCQGTIEDNGIGFTGCDATILTSFAEQYIQKGYLSPKQKVILFKKMPKYARQLVEQSIASGKIKHSKELGYYW